MERLTLEVGCSACSTSGRREQAHHSGRVFATRSAWQLPREAVALQRRRRRAADRVSRGCQALGSSSSSSNGNGVHTATQQQQQQAVETLEQHPQQDQQVWTKFVAETLLPTQQGRFRLRGYRHTVDGGRTYTEPSVIISGNPEGLSDVPIRVHDACFTSEVLGSLKCDCKEQLQLAMEYIRDHPPGMVIYLQQEGRGIGLANKIAAYALQEKGLDTVDANRALGLPDDCREYSAVAHILAELGVQSVRLMTNNPRKISEMAALGIPVTDRIPCQVQAQKYNAGYLEAKHRRMDHRLNPELYSSTDEAEPLEGQFCYWDHEGEPSSAGIPLQAPVPLPEGLEQAGANASSSGTSSAAVSSSSSGAPGSCGSSGGSLDG